jgi:hypothetical protein
MEEGWDPAQRIEIRSYAFDQCGSLQYIDRNIVKNIAHHAFDSCMSLRYVDFPHVTSVGEYAFNNCTLIVDVNLPKATKIEPHAFDSTQIKTICLLENCQLVQTEKEKDGPFLTPIDRQWGASHYPMTKQEWDKKFDELLNEENCPDQLTVPVPTPKPFCDTKRHVYAYTADAAKNTALVEWKDDQGRTNLIQEFENTHSDPLEPDPVE